MRFELLTEPAFHRHAVEAMFGLGVLAIFGLNFLSAPYGRHGREGWGPKINPRIGWMIMESPSVLLWGLFFFGTLTHPGIPSLVFLLMWMFHYVNRAFIYPFRMRVRPDDRMPVAVVALAATFNTLNAIVNAPVASGGVRIFSHHWVRDPHFLVGVALFITGTAINHWADARLRNLRKPGETGYKVPTGGLYDLVSCPNYLGELIAWTGWAFATWSSGGLAFAFFTAANLIPRALQNHAWYQNQFPEYPKERRAILPWIL